MIAISVALAAAAATATPLRLPAEPPVLMDYLAADGARVWIPAGNTGKVFLLSGGQFRAVDGFATKKGRGDRLMGPSAVTVGEGAVYVGNRGDSRIWAIDPRAMEKKGSAEMPSPPDGVFYVATTKEVWVTTPRARSIQILDVKDPLTPKLVGTITTEGEPEGYAVDVGKGIVYTNLEDADRTLAIDAKSRKVVSTWDSGCGKDGPRGLAIDAGRGVLFVACATAGVMTVDAKTGARKGRLEAGEGVDNIDYLPSKRLLYASAGRSEKVTVAHLQDDGSLKILIAAQVGKGSRVVVATEDGTAYAADSGGGELWVLKPGE
jgi:DNA-binding beta-propeller fold protein YncE